MTSFKICTITNNPEKFKVEMEAIFGTSLVLMWKIPKNERNTMVHLGFTLKGEYTVTQLRNMIPEHCTKVFQFDINLL